jgi:predicted ATP-dependent protease
MSHQELPADAVGLPEFTIAPTGAGRAFDLSSHAMARQALSFGLNTPGTDYNVYVLGPDRSGRMTATREFVEAWAARRPPADDWVYVFDFDAPATPRPLRLPHGRGRQLQRAVEQVLPALAREMASAFGSEGYQRQLQSIRSQGEAGLQKRMQALEEGAQNAGLTIVQTPQGAMIAALGEDGNPIPITAVAAERRPDLEEKARQTSEQIAEINRDAARFQRQFFETVKALNRDVAARAIEGLMSGLHDEFQQHEALADWLRRMHADVVDHHEMFLTGEAGVVEARADRAAHRYGVNLLVDRSRETHPAVVCEHNPTYENLFGFIEYRQLAGGGLDTDVTLIRAGALHRANGGVLILRAEALVAQPFLWAFLKGALRDGEIRIEEFYRAGSPPLAGAPKPVPVPLDVNVVIVGAPQWYYAFFAQDPEFQLYFKVKAEIEPSADATPENVACYAGLILNVARSHGIETSTSAVGALIAMASRWAEHRGRLTSRFELVADVLIEASKMVPGEEISAQHVRDAVGARRRRNGQVEQRVQRAIEDGFILIETRGERVGQVNGLTVQHLGDHAFGSPARITARASVGRRGVINIERLVAMSGPIQQKGSMVLQGILMRRFAHGFPLSFDCSVTFEQMYGGVEGDSASMAEFIAIISELADVPIRQDIAITGSINQLGDAQVIGGVHHKVEGFYAACLCTGGLTGRQGVVLPAANAINLVLRDEVRDAVAAGQFHLYTVNCVEDAIELFTGLPVGGLSDGGAYPADSVYGRVMTTLAGFDQRLSERGI